MKPKILKLVVQLSIGIVILLWLLRLADASAVLATILSLNPVYILLSSVLFILASTFIALALYVAIRRVSISPSLCKTVMASFGGQLLSDITPARSGYLLTPFILNKLGGIPVKSGMVGVLATGISNFFVKATISLVALAYFVRFLPIDQRMITALITGIFLLLVGGLSLSALMWSRRLPKLINKLRGLPMLGRAISKFSNDLNKLQEEGMKARDSIVWISLLVLLSIVANAMALRFILVALGHELSILDLVFIASLGSALMYLPVSIAGLGTQEGGYVSILMLLGMPAHEALAFALIARALFTGTDIIGLQPLLKIGVKSIAEWSVTASAKSKLISN